MFVILVTSLFSHTTPAPLRGKLTNAFWRNAGLVRCSSGGGCWVWWWLVTLGVIWWRWLVGRWPLCLVEWVTLCNRFWRDASCDLLCEYFSAIFSGRDSPGTLDSDCSLGQACCGDSKCAVGKSCFGKYCPFSSECSSGQSCCNNTGAPNDGFLQKTLLKTLFRLFRVLLDV